MSPAYTFLTVPQLITQISYLLDDVSNQYWSQIEIQYAIWEALRIWGAFTSYWRTRATFPLQIPPSQAIQGTYYDMSVLFPTLRPRTFTLGQMVSEIQYMLLENAPLNNLSGVGMSGQTSITSILNAIQDGYNRYLRDIRFPLSVHGNFAPTVPPGSVSFPQNTAYIHKLSWVDQPSGLWNTLWRQDAWSIDWNNPLWTVEPGLPQNYSESENSPLIFQLSPPPANEGYIEAVTVDTVTLVQAPTTVFNVPIEWIYAIKYAALSKLLDVDSQLKDPLRAEYAEMRYQQFVSLSKNARSVIRLLSNNKPLAIDPQAAIDAGYPTWRNQVGPPIMAGGFYDLLTFNPGTPDTLYGMAVDLVQAAPITNNALKPNYVPVGLEEIDSLKSYITHILTFKCGGNEFKSTMADYDDYMKAVAGRNAVSAAKIKYFEPIFGIAQREWQERPDAMGVSRG